MMDDQKKMEDLQKSLKDEINKMSIIANYNKKRLTENFLSRLCPDNKNEILNAINESNDNKVKEIIANTIFNKLKSVLENGCEKVESNDDQITITTYDNHRNTKAYIFDINVYNRNYDAEKNIDNNSPYNLSQYSHPNGTIVIGDGYLSITTDFYKIKYQKNTTTNNDEFNVDVSGSISGAKKVTFKVTQQDMPFDFLSSLSYRDMNDYLSTLNDLLYSTEHPSQYNIKEKKQLTKEIVISTMQKAQQNIQKNIQKKQLKQQNITIAEPDNGCCLFNLHSRYNNEPVIG